MKRFGLRFEYKQPEQEWFKCTLCGCQYDRFEHEPDAGDREVPLCIPCTYPHTNRFMSGWGFTRWGYGFRKNEAKTFRLLDKARAALHHLEKESKNGTGIRQTA